MSSAVRRALASASVAVCNCVAQISVASCSTQPGLGKIWRNSFCADATTLPLWSNTMARELVVPWSRARSEEHTSELQSRSDLVCRLLLEKKKKTKEHVTSKRCS